MTIRVALADDHRIVREGLRALIEGESDMEVVDEVDNGRSAVDLAREVCPDVMVIDLTMPELSGIEAIRRIVSESPKTRLLALSIHSDKRFVGGALSAGASGYLVKDCAFDELARAIRVVASGRMYLSHEIAHTVVETYVRNTMAPTFSTLSALTPREREVLQLVAEGKSVKSIALMLGLSSKTIETHRSQIMKKLNIDTTAGLVKYAIREGLTTLEP